MLTALPARLVAVPATALASHWLVAVSLLAGSLVGAWVGASWATRMRTATLQKVLAGLLVLMPAALIWTHLDRADRTPASAARFLPSPAWSPGSASASSPRSSEWPAASC